MKSQPPKGNGNNTHRLLLTESEQSRNDEQDETQPSKPKPSLIKLQLTLRGPYRPTVSTCLTYFKLYLSGLDQIQSTIWDPLWNEISKQSPIVLSTIPVGAGIVSLPIITTAVVVSPIVIGITLLFFPITIPLILLVSGLITCLIGLVTVILCTTRTIRTSIYDMVINQDWIQQYVLTSPIYQSIVYDTGDDDALPNPISILRWYVVPETIWYRLLFSLTVDFVGSMSYLIPVVGESFDGPWGPMQSMLIMAMYNQTSPNLKYVSLAEEWLPFTDVLPSATIGWMTENMPTIIEEWNELVGNEGYGSSFQIPSSLMIFGGSSGSSSAYSTTNNSNKNNTTTTGADNNSKDDGIPSEHKREVLREMQNLSGRLSVNNTNNKP